VPAVAAVEVWAFDPDGLRGRIDAFVEQHFARADELAFGNVELLYPDCAMAGVFGSAFGRTVVHDVRLAVVVEEQRRIDAVDILEPHGIGPRARWILCSRQVV